MNINKNRQSDRIKINDLKLDFRLSICSKSYRLDLDECHNPTESFYLWIPRDDKNDLLLVQHPEAWLSVHERKISCKTPRDQAKTDVFKPTNKLTKISLPKNVFKNSRYFYVGLPFCPSLPLLHRPTELLLVRATFSQISWYLRHTLERCYIFSQTFF